MPKHSFTVNYVTEDGILAGRNDSLNGNTHIPVEMEFIEITKTKVNGESPNYSVSELGVVAKINLKLKEVQSYGKTIDCIPGGITATMKVEGLGLDTLIEVLQNKGSREYVHIRSR